jgi:uncharacterized protein YbjT (DUF2867 family)
MTVLVVGASGFVGRALVARLADADVSVRAASRRQIKNVHGVQWVHGDVEDPATLPAVLEGIDVAYYLVHSLGKHGRDFRATDRRCAENFARAAEQSGCKRIVYLGGVAPRGRPSEHLASRLEVGEILRAAAMIIGTGSASWHIVRDLAARLPFMVLPRWMDSKSCPIALADVLSALVDAQTVPLPSSSWFDIPGPDVLRARDRLTIVAELDGRRIPSIRVPVLTPALSAMWLKLVSGADYALSRELVLGLTEDLLPQRSFWELTGQLPRWSFRAAAAKALAADEPSWFAAAVERLVRRIGPHVKARAE